MSPETKKTWDNIVDTISCADGGVRFINFRTMVEQLDTLSHRNDRSGYDANKCLTILDQVSIMIDLANKPREIEEGS